MDQEIEDRIRARARAIWEAEGRPDGRDLEHWEQAARELGAEGGGQAEPSTDPEEHGQIVTPTATEGR